MIERKDQKTNDTWDLSGLSASPEAWDAEIAALKERIPALLDGQGTLGESSDALFSYLEKYFGTIKEAERLLSYGFLSYSADSSNPVCMRMAGIASMVEAELREKTSWVDPEIMAIPEEKIALWLREERFSDYRIHITKSRRMKDHVLSPREERLMALHGAGSNGYQDAFHDLSNIDLDFGEIGGEKLTHSTYAKFIRSEDESVRKEAYTRLYAEYEAHQHVIARLYEGSVKNDIFSSRARGFGSCLESALYPDAVPESVYRSLIGNIHSFFPALHRYYEVKAKLLGKEKLSHWDVYVPTVNGGDSRHTYDEAVAIISEAVRPLGEEYRETLVKGLTTERWVDRYENRGKSSGAFSAGCYSGKPYILTNFEESVLDSMFTLIHEGGHSMHSHYSVASNPFPHYNYTIFEAEVASTFNEQLLSRYLKDHAATKEEKAYLIAKNLDDFVATFFRQTMFAEFELLVHEAAENGTPVTVDFLRKTYRGLLEAYFGPALEFADNSDLEGLRIPHFYNAFYVYKYATGFAASAALAKRVLEGGDKEREDYLSFLKSGGSKYPIEALRTAGVDMGGEEAVKAAGECFKALLDEFESLVF